MCTANTEKPLPHKLCSFTLSLRVCPASSASTEWIFSIYDLVCSEIRKSLDVEKAEKLFKIYWLCRAEEDNHWIYSNCLIYSSLFFKSLNFVVWFVWLKKIITESCISVLLILFFTFNRFFKGKVKSGFYCFFMWAF